MKEEIENQLKMYQLALDVYCHTHKLEKCTFTTPKFDEVKEVFIHGKH